jgi:hypothetical protein
MEQLSSIEIRVKTLVDAFLSSRITRDKFRRELAKEKVVPRKDRKAERKPHSGPRT